MNRRRKPTGRISGDDYTANIVARSELMIAVVNLIRENGWTQAQAAELLGVGQPRISDVVQGRVDRFTVDMLMLWLHKLGKDVSVAVRDNVFSTSQPVDLTLYVCGIPDDRVLENVAKLFGGNRDRYSLKVIDVLQNSDRAAAERITSTPCLVKESPPPRIVLSGDMSAASVRWQLATAERSNIDNRQSAQELRETVQNRRENELDDRENKLRRT